jgi:hypothetical protein
MPTNARQKKNAIKLIDESLKSGALGAIAQPGGASTGPTGHGFHIDRQVGTNANGEHKVAVQRTGAKQQGRSDTAAQVLIKGHQMGDVVSAKRVAAELRRSVKAGAETEINGPSGKEQKKAANISRDKAAQIAKKRKMSIRVAAGKAKAAAGAFRKGQKN